MHRPTIAHCVDPYPFGLLTFIVSLEGVLIASPRPTIKHAQQNSLRRPNVFDLVRTLRRELPEIDKR